jgi:hypothetical protein
MEDPRKIYQTVYITSIVLSSQLSILMSQIMSNSKPCTKQLEFDGISSNRFVLRDQSGKLLLSIKNVPTLKNKIIGLGNSITIVKNFDEYQYLICSHVPTLNDESVWKFKFQKIRILIYLYIDKLTRLLIDDQLPNVRDHELDTLNKTGNEILLETSEIIQLFRETIPADIPKLDAKKDLNIQIDLQKDHFEIFQIKEMEVNNILFSYYGYNLESIHSDHDLDDDVNNHYEK